MLGEIMKYLPLKSRLYMLSIPHASLPFNDHVVQLFVHRFRMGSLDQLVEWRQNLPLKDRKNHPSRQYVEKFMELLPSTKSLNRINSAARGRKWDEVQMLLENGVSAKQLAYSVRRAAANGFSQDLLTLKWLTRNSNLDFDAHKSAIVDNPVDIDELKGMVSDAGINFEIETTDIQTLDHLLELACESAHLPLVKFLINRGAEAYEIYGYHVEIVRLLIDTGVSINYSLARYLRSAAKNDNWPVVRLLFQNGLDAKELDPSVLTLAARAGVVDVVQLLFLLGIDLSTFDNHEPFCDVANMGNEGLVQMFVNAGADPVAAYNHMQGSEEDYWLGMKLLEPYLMQ